MKVKSIVELFAGIGGFRLAADEFALNTVWANDIDKAAASVYCDNFGTESFHLGDIRETKTSIPNHDILTAGFPCQPFSKAGYKKGIDDYRGTLFEEIISVLRERAPQFFILENVASILYLNKGKHFQTILLALAELQYRVEWKVINALDFGLPQNRERILIIGSLSSDIHASYMLNKAEIASLPEKVREQINSYFLWDEVSTVKKRFADWGIAYKEKYCSFMFSKNRISYPKLSTILQDDAGIRFDFTADTLKRIENSQFVGKYYNGVQILYNQAGGARMGYTIFGINGVAPTLTATTSRHYERYKVGSRYRRLTNVEYARLQGFPDDHCRAVSPYCQYKLYGNALPPCFAKWGLDLLLFNRLNSIDRPLTLYSHLEEQYGYFQRTPKDTEQFASRM